MLLMAIAFDNAAAIAFNNAAAIAFDKSADAFGAGCVHEPAVQGVRALLRHTR